ncbi:MAG: YhfC family intramembrane metalloprotease [Sphaerochaetaceae bacterium]|nr:YhfC family intramembrane metalloprotease [Sphaerochaetaceae bacterium]
MVPVISIIFMVVSCVLVFGLAIGLPFFLKIRKGADILPYPVGAAVMFLFAFVLETVVHRIVLSTTSIGSTLFPYAIYGGIMAGLFEETGRFVAFKTVLKNKLDKDSNALMYGAGHGCFEAVWLLGLTMINNIVWSVMINNGNAAELYASVPAEMAPQVGLTISSLTTSAPILFLAGVVERIFAIAIQMSLSVFVWFAVKKKKINLYFQAIGIHAAIDFTSAVASSAGVSVVLIEVMIGVFAVFCVVCAKINWDKNTGNASRIF